MKKDTAVSLEKINHTNSEVYSEDEANKHVDGNRKNGIPKGYTIIGSLLSDIEVGEPIRMLRTCRNGEKALGYFMSSSVKSITNNNIETSSSIYRIKKL